MNEAANSEPETTQEPEQFFPDLKEVRQIVAKLSKNIFSNFL